MHVLGHNDVSDYDEVVALASTLEGRFEEFFADNGTEMGLAVVAAEGDEVEVSGLVETN
jgi:hypothetical protein